MALKRQSTPVLYLHGVSFVRPNLSLTLSGSGSAPKPRPPSHFVVSWPRGGFGVSVVRTIATSSPSATSALPVPVRGDGASSESTTFTCSRNA